MKVLIACLAVVVAALGAATPAAAYVGPGAGLSLVGAFWGLLVAIFAALAFIVIWPVRRLLKRGSSTPAGTSNMAAEPARAPQQPGRRNA